MKTARLLVAAAAVASLASLPLMAQSVNASAQQNASGSAAGTQVNQSAGAGANASMNRGNASANGGAGSALDAQGRRGDAGGNGAADGALAAEGRRGDAGANGAADSALGAQGRRGSANADANGWAAGNAQMRPVAGELQGKLDSKTATVGEPVVLRTTQKTKTADGFVIPKGSRLIGHVTEVQAHARGHQASSMGIVFDRAELKNGQSFAIHSVIESVGPSAAQLEAASMASEDAMAGPAGGGMAAGGGAIAGGGGGIGRVGGGLVGGGAGAVGGATSAVGGVGSGIASNAGGALNAGGGAIDATGNLAGNAAANVGRGVNGSAGAVGSLGTHATAIPGVMLSSDAASSASGMFSAARQNIHFDSGTQMVLGVAAAK